MMIVFGTLSPMLSLCAFLFSVISVFYLNDNDIICFMFLLLPFANIFKIDPARSSLFTYLILFLVLVKFLKIKQYGNIVLISIALLLFTLIIQIANSTFSLTGTIKFVSYILLLTYCIACFDIINEYKKLFLSYTMGILIASTIAYFGASLFDFKSYLIEKSLGYSYGFGYISRFSGLDSDPNYYSINLIVAMALMVILYLKKDFSLIKTITYFALIIPFIVLTFSKSALLMMFYPILLFVYSNIKKKKIAPFFVAIPIVLTVVFVVLSKEFLAKQIVMARFAGDKLSDINGLTTGRLVNWENYVNYMIERPYRLLFGSGIGAPWVNGHAAHNIYLEALYHIGLIGSYLLLISYKKILNIVNQKFNKNIFNYSIVICLIVMYFFLSELFYFDSPFQIILAFIVFQMNLTIGDEENEVFDNSSYFQS